MSMTPDWFIANYGPRCTLVSAAAGLQLLGAKSPLLVDVIETNISFSSRYGPNPLAYLSLMDNLAPLDRAIELAANAGGIKVKARTKFFPSWAYVFKHFSKPNTIAVLNCLKAPGGKFNHSVLAYAIDSSKVGLETIDPNTANSNFYYWHKALSGIVITVTFIELA